LIRAASGSVVDHIIDELRKALDLEIEMIEVETHINTPEFARAVEEVLRQAL